MSNVVFAAPVVYALIYRIAGVTIADFNQDGKQDVGVIIRQSKWSLYKQQHIKTPV
ncbi:MAG: VCBS repeat-containing protein [Candidatus Midichloria mitochondrii]|uniref:Uncharacterized protein n=1 Tax=Midichloria mitochondrii (strain IricVA) TaxID=696127 RepID=F7XUN2_MIDMI|nr:VCBS repeat-containing protein [Candidatus Midichloria mitochondrii]AEI88381.1 hypothetical protein midi_00055 [Candidatus Midichloria mitochondrii IricVA]MDJ1256977.1 VCBS repeat-containing protein [Candidatus Midichloria mitochondrii]MDJ1288727.1 VCBS repeat-containing protein [Candidatus Midichloria mitochondrii]MDJ1299555.1 VCBS repeat-containing protein [Candidatus Midichloria mitochondrii]MDJ1313649.1 VCBS repeat-containing protein [Candidatus Midichloria mitochondrii]